LFNVECLQKFHQTFKYGCQRNQILQDLTGLETEISMKASNTKNRLETGVQQSETGLRKDVINISSHFRKCVLIHAYLLTYTSGRRITVPEAE